MKKSTKRKFNKQTIGGLLNMMSFVGEEKVIGFAKRQILNESNAKLSDVRNIIFCESFADAIEREGLEEISKMAEALLETVKEIQAKKNENDEEAILF